MPSSCALLGGFAIDARVALLWQHNDVRALLAGDRRMTGSVLKIARRIWEVGVAGWPSMGGSQYYCGGLDCGLPVVAFW